MNKKDTQVDAVANNHSKRWFQSKLIPLILGICILVSGIGLIIASTHYREAKNEYLSLQEHVTYLEGKNRLMFDIDWDALRDINPDIVGWICIPDTNINYPIVQGCDNEHYIKYTFEGDKNPCGAIFMECKNRADFSDQNTVIYGHNMRDGSMFHTLNAYQDATFAKEHSDIWICTPEWQRDYRIISGHIANGGDETYTVVFMEEEYKQHIAREVSKSLYATETVYNTELPMVTLSTCNRLHSNKRMVLVAQPIKEILVEEYE